MDVVDEAGESPVINDLRALTNVLVNYVSVDLPQIYPFSRDSCYPIIVLFFLASFSSFEKEA